MKRIFVQKQVTGWEQYTYEVPDDFDDYESLLDSTEWIDWEYMEDAGMETGLYEIYDEDWHRLDGNV